MLKNLILFLLAALATAQTKPAQPTTPAAKQPAKPAAKAPETPDAAAAGLPSEDTVNSFLYQMFGHDPTVSWKVVEIRPSEVAGLSEITVVITNQQGSNMNKLYVTADGKHALTGEILPFGAKPFADARSKLEKGVNGPAKGPAKAPVTIVEFSDMQCPHCKEAAPTVDKLLAQEPNTRFILQTFPLPSHNWAEKAADYVDCVGRSSNEAVWKFVQKTYDQQDSITESNADEKLKAIATESGAKGDEIAACAAKPETKARVEASVELGKSVGVTGTPTLSINGRMLPANAPLDALKRVVDFQASLEEKHEDKANSK